MGVTFHKTYTNAAEIAAGSDAAQTGSWHVGVTDTDKNLWAPFNMATIHNNSSNAIELRLETSYTSTGSPRRFYIPAGGILEFDIKENIIFYTPFIFNADPVNPIPIGEIIVEVEKIV